MVSLWQDKDGKWEVGAMATLIDIVGGFAVYASVGHPKASVEFNISFYSIVKIQVQFLILF
ncbi:hypothetical protein Patl1_01155 [Pistacia atlantica]|uniref:Uncharacterized protein n=1 Tax=Pistacia atlantica TaxID=434234 RepID=A0ACC1C7E5_9ROSI|nr:hypothetical protein Patl1_01155 [Pistacia atlantica]